MHTEAHSAAIPAAARVVDRASELDDVATVRVELPEGVVAPAPGQFFMVAAPGNGEVPISVSQTAGHVLSFTVRSVGLATAAIVGLAAGSTLLLRGPFGTPWPMDAIAGRDLVIVAGGLGLAPLRQAFLDACDADAHRSLSLLYGTRTPGTLLYERSYADWSQRARLRLTVDSAPRDHGATWHGDVGPVTILLDKAVKAPDNALAFVCGPEIMMRYVAIGLLARGVAPERVYLSLERNMKCANGTCGHCQVGPLFVCKDGPVVAYSKVERLLRVREL